MDGEGGVWRQSRITVVLFHGGENYMRVVSHVCGWETFNSHPAWHTGASFLAQSLRGECASDSSDEVRTLLVIEANCCLVGQELPESVSPRKGSKVWSPHQISNRPPSKLPWGKDDKRKEGKNAKEKEVAAKGDGWRVDCD